MLSIPLILAAGSLFTLISGAPVPSFPLGSVIDKSSAPLAERDTFTYITYGGNGEAADGWPTTSQWLSFETMFTNNIPIMKESCGQWNVANPSDQEISDMHDAILSVASSTNIDSRFILAIILQESNGCPRVPTTNNGVINPGLMQDHDGAGNCNNNGVVQNPCPSSEILQMIKDGTEGTSEGDGLQQCLQKSGATDDSKYYKAARIYNSGSMDSSGNLGLGGATHCYCSDVANRLMGWDAGVSSCVAATVGTLTTTVGFTASSASTQGDSAGSSSSASSPAASSPAAAASSPAAAASPVTPTPIVALSQPSTTPAPAAAAPSPVTDSNPAPVVVTVTNTAIPIPAATSAVPEGGSFLETSGSSGSGSGSSGSSSSSAAASSASSAPAAGVPIYPYAVSNCQEYYTVVAGDYCILVEQKYGITPQQLESWNSGLDDACTNLWLGYQYCVKA